MNCKNCGHKIFLFGVEQMWFHKETIVCKLEGGELQKTLCAEREGIITTYEVEGGEIEFTPMCGCTKPEPLLKSEN